MNIRSKYSINYITLVSTLLIAIITICSNGNLDAFSKPEQGRLPETSNSFRFVEYIYSPLTYEKFSAIYSSIDEFSALSISYKTLKNYNQYGVPMDRNDLLLQCHKTKVSDYLNGVEIYIGDLETINASTNPRNELFLKEEFTDEQVDALYSYVLNENHRSFFFNGAEYNEQDPFISPLAFICEGNYRFALSIEDPENSLHLWAIHKCVDEYPEEGTPLYGLFQMLENDFISQFEE